MFGLKPMAATYCTIRYSATQVGQEVGCKEKIKHLEICQNKNLSIFNMSGNNVIMHTREKRIQTKTNGEEYLECFLHPLDIASFVAHFIQ